MDMHPDGITRGTFLQTGVAAAVLAAAPLSSAAAVPGYRRAYRWGQTNITEQDPVRYDIGWWREPWKRTETQAVIVNAGGIVAYYPSRYPLHHQAEFLGGRDLFDELTKAAHDEPICSAAAAARGLRGGGAAGIAERAHLPAAVAGTARACRR